MTNNPKYRVTEMELRLKNLMKPIRKLKADQNHAVIVAMRIMACGIMMEYLERIPDRIIRKRD
jgi:hypothetical protein